MEQKPQAFHMINQDGGEITIISCTGLRGLAVVSPIYTLINRLDLKPKEINVALFVTPQTEIVGLECKDWLEKTFWGIKTYLLPFKQGKLFWEIEPFVKRAKTIFFNSNPGMNWENAEFTLYLPENAYCFYGDSESLFIWGVKEDIKTSEKVELIDMGLENYNFFSKKKFFEHKGINEGLTANIKELLEANKLNRHFSFWPEDIAKDPEISDFIKNRLVWVRERHGFIYLLFDFQTNRKKSIEKIIHFKNEEGDDEKIHKEEIPYHKIYRAVTEIFDPLNFTVTIITDDFSLKDRAAIDGVGFIHVNKNNEKWKEQVLRWIKGVTKIIPKYIIHQAFKEDIQKEARINYEGTYGDSCLFVCLGDNIEPTIKAILSHNREDNYVFYDKNSPRISYLARNIQKVFNNRNITIVPTDNIGSDIKDYIIKHSENRKRIDINITPGTKSQSIALAQAARTMGKPYLLYSIKGDLIQNIVNTSISFEVIGPSVEDLIKCHALYYRGSREIPEIPIFLDIMKGLANKSIRPKKKNQKDILGININGRPVFSKNMSMSFSDCCYLDCILDGKTYVFPVDFLEDKIEGIWWEAVCAYVIKSNLTDNIIWSATWEWPAKKKDKSFFSEIDIVFKWKNFICTVSCKTSAIRGSKSLTKFSIESKAKKHFGRFTLPFVAIPYDQYKDKDYAGIIEDGIMFLTPSIMIDPEKMEKKIIEFVKSKRTT